MQLKWRSPYEKYVKSTDCLPPPSNQHLPFSFSVQCTAFTACFRRAKCVKCRPRPPKRPAKKVKHTHTHTQSHRNMNSVSVVEHNMDMEHTHTNTHWQTSLDLPPVLDFVLPRFCHLVNLQSACKAYAAYAQCAPKQRTNVCVCVCVYLCLCTMYIVQCSVFLCFLFFVFYFPFFFNIFARTCSRVCVCVSTNTAILITV